MAEVRLGSHIHIIGSQASFVKFILKFSKNNRTESVMAEKTNRKTNGAVKKGVSFWQTDWMTKVMSNGHNAQAKLVFLRIASFGEKGCWMNNETFSEEFSRSDRTVRRAVSSLWGKGDIIITGWNGHGRKMYAASHPKVAAVIRMWYIEEKQKGKCSTKEEFYERVRFRQHEPEKVEETVVAGKKEVQVKSRGLKAYLAERKKEGNITEFEGEK